MRLLRRTLQVFALLTALLILPLVHDVWFSGFFGEKFTSEKHRGLRLQSLTYSEMLHRYYDKHGEYPERLSVLFKEKDALWTSYPRTPWGTQQVSDIEAVPSDLGDKVKGTDYGQGKEENPTKRTDYGAVCYLRDSKNRQRFDLTLTGRKHGAFGFWTDRAYCLIHIKNY